MTIKPYYAMDYDLSSASGFVSKETGEYVKLVPNDKFVYAYVRARVKFFVDEKKGAYYDTQESIAEALNMDVKSARNCLNKFINHGIITAKKEKFRNFSNWRYSEVKEMLLWRGSVKEPVIMDQILAKTPLKSTITPEPRLPYWEVDNDDSGPF